MKGRIANFFIFILFVLTYDLNSDMPPSGSIIENKAEAIYYDEVTKDYKTKYSNSVVVTIANVLDFILTPLEIKKESYRSEKVYFHHEFINRSNTIVDVNISYGNAVEVNESADDFDLLNLEAYIDVNENAIIDENDIKLIKDIENPTQFEIEESKQIIIRGDVPSFVNFNNTSEIKLQGSIPLEKTLVAIDTVNILVEPELEIIGYADKEQAEQLDTYVITQETRNISEADALPTKVLVDANLQEYIVVESPIPANTTFEIRERGDEDLFVYQIAESETERETYVTERPADLTQISKVAFLYKKIEKRSIKEGSYSVKINNNATNFVINKHNVVYTTNNIEEREKESEDIIVEIPEIEEDLNNFNDNFLGVVNVIRIGGALNIEANAASCNIDPSIREEYEIEITTDISNDFDKTYKVIETQPNSGIFRIPEIPTIKFPENSISFDNGILEVTTKDNINILLICPNSQLTAKVLVDPLGVVFDSYTNLPIANVKVELLKVDSSGNITIPVVYDLEGNEISNIQFTDEDGLYWFPIVESGNYRFRIAELESYLFPSERPISFFEDRDVLEEASYGRIFEITESDIGAIGIDIPLDPIFNNNLLINKEVEESVVSVGETVGYTISITNLSNDLMENIIVNDLLPLGFEILNVEGVEFDKENNQINFKIPALLSGETLDIRYKTLVKMNAINGTAINTAIARNEIYESNIARARVEVVRESIFENPLILGKIYKDCNVNNLKDEDEIGIPGVRIYMQNGSYAITDKNGNYKFYNLQAKTNVLRIDKTTLVKPYNFEVIDNRNAKDPFSAFADLKYGELHRRDFRDTDCSVEAKENIENRINNIKEIKTEVERSSERNLEFNALNIKNDLGREDSEGLINENSENINKIYALDKEIEQNFEDSENINNEDSKENESFTYKNEEKLIKDLNSKKEFKLLPTTIDFKKYMDEKGINNEIGFLDLNNDDVLSQNQISIRIKGKNIGNLQLLVNNEIINNDQVGQSVNFKDKGVLAVEYIAVKLKTGINIVEVRMVDSFGNIRGSEAIKVLAAGEMSKIKLNLPEGNQIPANSDESFPILINVTDKNNIPVVHKFVITLDTTIGYWDVEDINENEEGIQTNIEGGEGLFDFIPPNSQTKGQIKIKINDLEIKEDIYATTYLRDLFAVGIVDGTFNFKDSDFEDNVIYTGLEKEVESFEVIEDGTARVALFLKGKVKGDYLLTLSYDSDKNEREKLFRDIEPEEFYPIYGDSSINGFEAQSTTQLYVKVSKGNSFIMYGDLNTRNYGNDNINLGNYNRTLTGIRQVYNNQEIELSYYVAEESFGARVIEIEGNGGFGSFDFANGEQVVINSEKVSIITRDRITGGVISEEIKSRFVDYEINGFYEGIVFREAIPSLDRDFNPVFIRVEYEVETENEKYFVYGVSGEYKFNNDLKIGANYNRSEEENNEYNITSTYAEYDKNNLKLNIEVAQSDNGEKGYAARLNAKYNKNGNLVEVRYQKQDDKFENEFSSAQNISEEATIRSRTKLTKNLNLNNSLFLTKQNEQDKENRTIKTTIEHSLNDYIRLEGGLRYTDTKIADFESDSTMGSARITWQPKFMKDINTYFEYEQDFDISEINRQEIGLEYQFTEKSNIYIQQERLSNLSAEFELTEEKSKTNRTIIGTDYKLNESTDIYSEYRIDEVISEQDAEAVVGVRNTFDINEKWKGNLSLERIEAVEGDSQTSTSVSGALQHTVSRDWKTIYRLQYLKNEDSAFYSGSVGYIRKLNNNFSFLAKDSLAYDDGEKEWRNRFYSGFAYRDNKENELNYLFKYENEYIKSKVEKEVEHDISFQFNKKMARDHTLSGLYAYKNVKNKEQGVNYSANWISGRYLYNINEDWDMGISGGYLFDNETSKNYVIGAEVGYLVKKNMWISLGYNFEGLSDNNYSNESFHQEGVYARFRLKLDEESFKWLQ